MKALHLSALIITVIGGLNWLLVGLIGWDIGELFGGQGAIVSRIIYILVGLAAIYLVATHKKECKPCETSAAPSEPSPAPPPPPGPTGV